jgi:hypothetical protein
MESRPKIQPELLTADIIIELAGWLALSVLWFIKSTFSISSGKQSGLGSLSLPLMLLIIFIPLSIFIYKSFKAK